MEQRETIPTTWIQARLETLYQEGLETLLKKTKAEHGRELDTAQRKELETRYQKILELRAKSRLDSELSKAYAWEWQEERRRRLALVLLDLFEAIHQFVISVSSSGAATTPEMPSWEVLWQSSRGWSGLRGPIPRPR
jgi:hypothetical protein